MVFSYDWDLRINGISVTLPFGGLRFTHKLSGFGTSGIVTGLFEFDIYDEYGLYGEALLEHAEAQLFSRTYSLAKSRVYYIAKRSISKKVCHFTAYDIDSDLEKEFDPTGLWQEATKETIQFSEVLNALQSQCGFPSITVDDEGMTGIKFTQEMLTGKSCRAVLEMFSTAMCGVWCNSGNGGLQLICLDKKRESYYDSGSCTEYSEIDYQGRQKITKLVAVNSETGKTEEHSIGQYGTVIEIQSPFVACDEGTDGYVWQRIQGLEYQGWKCDKALIDLSRSPVIFNTVSSLFAFGEDTELLANQIVLDVDASGIYFSGGADPQDDEVWKYDDYMQRQLKQKVEINKSVGNMTITAPGDIVFRNEN
ncbi:MAG: hypothetical protein J1F11_03455 [Oscillospiraceae bacterium]|nr:hypothetical protein [Oscillospiraceae bacterium]